MVIQRYLRGLCVVASLCGSEAAAEVAIEVAAGSRHTCALTAQGGARCWGDNDLQQLGDGTSTPSGVPVEVVGLPGPLTAIGVGIDGYSCGLSAGGAVLCWGQAFSPLTGPPTVLPGLESGIASIDFGNYKNCVVTTAGGVLCGASEWTAVPGLASGVAQVAAGMDFACALSTSGGVSCWGDNFQGQLGADRETVPYSETPLEVAGLSGVASISAGLTHACARMLDGAVKCWGGNNYGQTSGQCSPWPPDPQYSATPLDVPGLSGVAQIDLNGWRSCALLPQGEVRCWGFRVPSCEAQPAQVVAPGSGATSISVGASHACITTDAGAIRCWGDNSAGQLGIGRRFSSAAPIETTLSVAATSLDDAGYPCIVSTAGGVWCWPPHLFWDETGPDTATPTLVSYLSSGIAAMSRGLALTTTGAVLQDDGQVVPGLGDGVASHSVGQSHGCFVTTAGAALCQGSNTYGQLGIGPGVPFAEYAEIVWGFGSGVAAISAGSNHTCARTTGGAAWCWGRGQEGQLGHGSLGFGSDRNVPTAVSGLGSGVAAVTTGGVHSCALVAGGVLCWGLNANGQLGDGTTTNRAAPVPVSGLSSGVVSITAGNAHTCARMTTGEVRCWGANGSGQLGDGSYQDRHEPVAIPGLPADVVAVVAGLENTYALRANGVMLAWGSNDGGELADGSLLRSNAPLPVVGFENAVQVPLVGAPGALLLALLLAGAGAVRLRRRTA